MSCYVPTNKYKQVVPAVAAIAAKVNKVPTLEKQAPNRVGNKSIKPANDFGGRQGTGGVTNPPPYGTNVAYAKGSQGAPKANGNPISGNKVNAKSAISRPKDNYGSNDSYRNSSYLK